ncbi:MAG: lysozyme inhibitor LprI family protein, partial [Chthoniobacterales bacterium]
DSPNYLVDVKNHRVIGKIEGVNYFKGQNHAYLGVQWSGDSGFCIADYDERFGFGSILLLEPRKEGLTQTNIGTKIQSALDTVTRKKSPDPKATCEASASMRIGKDRKIRFRVISTTNPKQLDDRPNYCAFFQGAYDVNTKSWTVGTAQPISVPMYDSLSAALFSGDWNNIEFSNAQDAAEAYDRFLNDAYSALRFVLPKAQFDKIKVTQIAWLKERDAAPDLAAKNLLVKTRAQALQDLLW